MDFTAWYLIVGGLLVFMALSATLLRRLPLTSALLYLGVGVALGPWGAGLIRIDPVERSALLERLTEAAVIVSLFAAGLKLRLPLSDRAWRVPIRLAFGSMALTVGLIAAAGVLLLGLPIGVAVLLAAILAPTDPVLASDVQVSRPGDADALRFGLTGEAGLNDGTAFPFVMLGLGLIGAHELGAGGWRWLAIDLAWAVIAGLAIGAATGWAEGRLVLYLRKTHREALGLDDFLSLGLIAVSYGAALAAHAYGFLAVFAAGLALRAVERRSADRGGARADVPASLRAESETEEREAAATNPKSAPAYMAGAVLAFNEHLERIFELAMVLLLGGMLTAKYLPPQALWFVPLLLLVIRPIAVYAGLAGAGVPRVPRRLMSWFGIRGIGSIYYLMYAIQHGLTGEYATLLTGLVFASAATSIAAHGISVTPLMNAYGKWQSRRARLEA
jgi:NhaP-type Na+/H+ or K+/H+ antiporter